MINIHDNFLSEQNYRFVLNYCYTSSYSYGECDIDPDKPTGMIHEIHKDLSVESEKIYNLFDSSIKQNFTSIIESLNLYRMYINCFAPSENPYFHTDGQGYTFLYYVNDNWEIDDGGETQFLINGNLYGITPIPNRIVYFDGQILHKATSFRDRHRFTVAIKYGKSEVDV